MKPKNELIRIVRSPEGEVTLDNDGKKPGRGAYVCGDNNCIKRVKKTNALARALKKQIPDSIMEEMHGSSNH